MSDKTSDARSREVETFRKADDAFHRGDVEALRAALGNPDGFPNVRGPKGIECCCLQYAIYHSPLTFIHALLELGADPNYDDLDGFPSLVAALSFAGDGSDRSQADVHQLLELLLAYGADPNQRGINDCTPLHYAAGADDDRAVEILLAHGADPTARTGIDDRETPLEGAERAGRLRAAAALRRALPPR